MRRGRIVRLPSATAGCDGLWVTADTAVRASSSSGVLALLGLSQYYLVRLLEKQFIPWHVSQRSGQGLKSF
jgi:hypothetical protein